MSDWDGKTERRQNLSDPRDILNQLLVQQAVTSEQLKNLNERVDRHSESYEALLVPLKDSINTIVKTLSGKDDQPGLVARVLVIEKYFTSIWALWVIVFASIIGIISKFITSHFNR